MSEVLKGICPVCRSTAHTNPHPSADRTIVKCQNCGDYEISDSCKEDLFQSNTLNSNTKKASVGHWLRQQQRYGGNFFLTSEIAVKLAAKPLFPPLKNQLENLLIYLGDTASSPGINVDIATIKHQYIIGAQYSSAIESIISHLKSNGLIEKLDGGTSGIEGLLYKVKLTFSGWLRYEEISRGASTGRRAFLATPFNKPDLDDVWFPKLKDAVQETGFDLKRVDDEPKPGLIDVRMRMQIKEARFLIVELTHANLGAYWEAGYAEGLGKPVIYTCHKDVERVHFDVDHSLRVVWHPENIDDSLSIVKATIRNALPDANSDQG